MYIMWRTSKFITSGRLSKLKTRVTSLLDSVCILYGEVKSLSLLGGSLSQKLKVPVLIYIFTILTIMDLIQCQNGKSPSSFPFSTQF